MISKKELEELKEKVLGYSIGEFPRSSVYAIILYAGACKYHFGLKEEFGDYDVNLFFISDKQNRKLSIYGRPKIIGSFKSKKVEIWRNLIIGKNKEFDIKVLMNYMESKIGSSKRWGKIASQKLLLIYPYISEFSVRELII
ncbi:MAG: hypothetical protein ABIH65_03855 [Nanoarchaeota archaeon]